MLATSSRDSRSVPADPLCDACQGTGFDTAFETVCHCTDPTSSYYRGGVWVERAAAHAAGGTLAARGGGFHRPGTRVRPLAASEKQVAYLRSLVERVAQDHPTAVAAREALARSVVSRETASLLITDLKALTAATSSASPARTNRYAGTCHKCGGNVPAEAGALVKDGTGWLVEHTECPAADPVEEVEAGDDGLDLTGMVSGCYAVPGGDTRLKVKIDVVTKGKWDGWVFVKDAAVYGSGQKYGSQRPGQFYRGQIEDALRAIAADPYAAAAEYGRLTSTCGVCGRPLEDAESVARGIGPVCARKF